MWRRAVFLAALLALCATPALTRTAATPARLARAAAPAGSVARAAHPRRASRVRPRAFASCRALVRYTRQHFAQTKGVPDPPVSGIAEPALAPVPVGAAQPGAPVPAAAAQGTAGGSTSTPQFSTTNNQDAGVDEPDVAKTDGSTIFFVSQRTLYAVSVQAGTPRLAGSLDLGSSGAGSQLLLRGNRLIVISRLTPYPVPLGAPGAGGAPGALRPAPAVLLSPYYQRAQTLVSEVDVSDPVAMRVTRTMTVDGSFVDARQNGSTARLVIASAPQAIYQPAARAQPRGWVPARSFHSLLTGRRYVRPVARCAAINRPVQFSGLGMLTILTLNLDKGLWTAGSQALMADAQIVYGSTGGLYVATQKWLAPQTPVAQLPPQTTVIYRFDATNPDTTTFLASGEVPGYLLNQFSLSEYGGYLRVATTSRPIWWGSGPPQSLSQSYVTVLAQQGGTLAQVGQVSGLGRGQQIYSVRFVGNTGYVVTFRQVDPLYVIDLSTPTSPTVTGQLELQGYSAYLHPLGNGLLLGVGQDVGTSNEPSGAQLELFDVSNPKAPALLARASLGAGSSTQAQFDHHAFLYWPPTGLAVLPVELFPPVTSVPPQPGAPTQPGTAPPGSSPGSGPTSSGSTGSGSTSSGPTSSGSTSSGPTGSGASSSPSDQPFIGAVGLHVDRGGIGEVGRITHPATASYQWPIQRALVIGNRLFTLSDAGVMASTLDTLSQTAFVAFPAPQPQPQPLGVATSPPAARPASR